MQGFWGRLLHVDLSTGRSGHRALDDERLRACLGGVGLGTSLLLEYAPAGVDPLSADNPLIFTSAPLVGTPLTTTAKFAVVTKSPLTGFIADSLSSSHFALELKRLGIDALVVTGAAASLAYLLIEGDRLEVRSAGRLRGMSPSATQAALESEVGSSAWIASIGAAGERLVRFATISNEGRHAGRGGVGAVMGAKHLKAIAIRGALATPISDAPAVESIAESLRKRSVGSMTAKYRRLGTVANLSVFNHLGALPTRNFQQATFEDADAVSGESLIGTSFSRRHGCASCTIRCERLFSSPRTGGEQRLEYETLFALGPLCGIRDPDYVLEAARLCDEFGLDTISAGGTLAWAIETAAHGLLPDAGGPPLRFGDGESLLDALRAIGTRSGIGDLLAEGSRRAACEAGGDAPDWAMHVKGLELPGYEPRSLKTMALGLAVSPRGACHNRSGSYEADFSGAVDRLHGDAGRGAIVAASENLSAVLDSLIVCKFLRRCLDDFYGETAAIVSAVTGWHYTSSDMRQAGERIHTMKKLFNVREGWQAADDWLPARLLTEPLSGGVAHGVRLLPGELREMIDGYYQARGWDAAGLVPAAKLEELSIARRLLPEAAG